LKADRARFASTTSPEFLHGLDADIASSTKALVNRRPLSGPATCKHRIVSGHNPEPWPAKFKLVLLTDSACFSSCLEMTDEFRKLGAIQMGQATNAATHYMEVREIKLPSGLSYFSTLQKVALDAPPRVGPFQPDYVYDGDIA